MRVSWAAATKPYEPSETDLSSVYRLSTWKISFLVPLSTSTSWVSSIFTLPGMVPAAHLEASNSREEGGGERARAPHDSRVEGRGSSVGWRLPSAFVLALLVDPTLRCPRLLRSRQCPPPLIHTENPLRLAPIRLRHLSADPVGCCHDPACTPGTCRAPLVQRRRSCTVRPQQGSPCAAGRILPVPSARRGAVRLRGAVVREQQTRLMMPLIWLYHYM